MDEATKLIIQRVEHAWRSGRGGRFRTITTTADPREYVVRTEGVFDKARARLEGHGLKIVQDTGEEYTRDRLVTVRVLDDMWAKLLAIPAVAQEHVADAPISPAPLTLDAALELLEARTSPALAEALKTVRNTIQDAQGMSDEMERLKRENERLEGAQEDDLEQIEMLNKQLADQANLPEMLHYYKRLMGSETKDDALPKKLAEGYEIAQENFVSDGDDGTPIYCARLVRRKKPAMPPMMRPFGQVGAYALQRQEPNGHASAIIDLRGGSDLAQRLREQQMQDDAEIAPKLDQMAQVLHDR